MRFEIVDGVLVAADREAAELVVPDGVTRIADEAFYAAKAKRILLPDGVREVGGKAFGCAAVEELTLPRSVETVGNRAFDCAEIRVLRIENPDVFFYPEIIDHCYDLEDVYFAGTKEQWDKAFDTEFQPYSAAFRLHLADGEVIQY